MPFQNASIITNKLNSTTMTGGTIYTAGTEFSVAKFSANRLIEFTQRSPVVQALNTGTNNVEAIAVTITIPAGTLQANDSMEIYHLANKLNSGSGTKQLRIRFGTAGTTSDTLISQVTTTTSTFVCPVFGRICFKSNSAFEWVSANGYFQTTLGTFGSATTVSLSANTTYITISGTRADITQDALEFDWTDVFINRP